MAPKPKSWDVGLPCRVCGQRVKRGSGFYVWPVGGTPWARHTVRMCPQPKEGQ